MDVLCAAAEVNINVLHFVQDLADGRAKEYGDDDRLRHRPSCEGTIDQVPSSCLDARGNSTSPKKGTQVVMPVGDSRTGDKNDGKGAASTLGHQARTPITLNILGMQPNFKEVATTDLSPITPGLTLAMPTTPSKLKVTFMNWETPGKKLYTPESVRTQSLIEDESIPNTPVSIDSSCSNVGSHKSRSSSPNERPQTAPITSIALGPTLEEGQTKSNHGRSSTAPTAASALGTMVSVAVSTPMEEKLQSLLSPSGVGQKCLDDGLEGAKSRKAESRCTHYTHSVAALSGWEGGGRGSQLPPSTVYLPSFVSLPPVLDEGGEFKFNSRFELWPSEVCVAYTMNMSSIAIYGRTSGIQEAALNGWRGQEMSKHGLTQLAGFQLDQESGGKSYIQRRTDTVSVSLQ